MPHAYAYFQGRVVPIEEAKISIMTHALHYGTAVFEGIRGNWNADDGCHYLFRMREHFERLAMSSKIMMLNLKESTDRLCELNVIEQTLNVGKTTVIRDAWARGQSLAVHGWIYKLSDGLLRDLNCTRKE